MSFYQNVLYGIIILVLFFVVIGIGWYIRNNRIISSNDLNIFSAPLGWSQPVPGPNPNKNTCQLYTFPASTATINNNEVIVPGNPTLNRTVLDNIAGFTDIPLCIDSDQILAQQQQHTCIEVVGAVDGAITRCNLISGGTTGLGGTDTFYSNSGNIPGACPGITQCPGQLAVISINYQVPNAPIIQCIQANGPNNNVTINTCDPSNSDQLLKLTLINPGEDPTILSSNEGTDGIIGQILDRSTNLCITKGQNTIVSEYNFSFWDQEGTNFSYNGNNVILDSCTGGPYPGYDWLFLPPVKYCGIASGCNGCTGDIGCGINNQFINNPNPNLCTCDPNVLSCTSCSGYSSVVSPPQISFIGNLNINNSPFNPNGSSEYNGLTGPSAGLKWLSDNNSESLFNGGTNNQLVTLPISLNFYGSASYGFVSQYLNINNFNNIIDQPVCILNTSNCINF